MLVFRTITTFEQLTTEDAESTERFRGLDVRVRYDSANHIQFFSAAAQSADRVLEFRAQTRDIGNLSNGEMQVHSTRG